MEGRQGRQELGLSRNGRMLAGFSYRVKLLGPQSQALVRQLPLPATSPPQKQHRGHWVMLEGPSKSLSAHRMALQLCFDMPIPRISSNQAENASYPMGIKHSEQNWVHSFLVVVTKPISGSTSIFQLRQLLYFFHHQLLFAMLELVLLYPLQ